jgi:hypothetical protein
MEINMLRFDIKPENAINLTGRDVWALQAHLADIASHGAGEKWNDVRAKPTGF